MRFRRPDWDTYFLSLALAVSGRADCTRRQVGAVVVNDNRIVSTGYNGAPAGQPGCMEGHCPRGRIRIEECPPNSPYDNCIAIHAEANALLYADFDRCKGATLYCTAEPCHECARLIKATGIARLVTL